MAAIFNGRLIWNKNLMEIPLGVCHPSKHQGQCPPQLIL
jgi:hypothetical protein